MGEKLTNIPKPTQCNNTQPCYCDYDYIYRNVCNSKLKFLNLISNALLSERTVLYVSYSLYKYIYIFLQSYLPYRSQGFVFNRCTTRTVMFPYYIPLYDIYTSCF